MSQPKKTLASMSCSLMTAVIQKKFDHRVYTAMLQAENAGKEFDVDEVMKAAQEEGHLTMTNYLNFEIARAVEVAVASGQEVELTTEEEVEDNITEIVKGPDGPMTVTTRSKVTTKVTKEVKRGSVPQNPRRTVTRKETASTGQKCAVHMIQGSVTAGGADTYEVTYVDDGSRRRLDTTAAGAGSRSVESETVARPVSLGPASRVSAEKPPCKDGIHCRNKNCTWFTHPPERPESNTYEWHHTVPCNAKNCKGLDCWFDHPVVTTGIPADIIALFKRFVAETDASRLRGECKPKRTWAMVHGDEFAQLVSAGLLPQFGCKGSKAGKAGGEFCPPAQHGLSLEGLEFAETQAVVSADGSIRIGETDYQKREYGSWDEGSGGQMCLYRAITEGKAGPAAQLKKELAPVAAKIGQDLGVEIPGAFGELGVPGDTEVAMAYVWRTRRPLCIAALNSHIALFIRPTAENGSSGDTIYLLLKDGHYTRLYRC